MPVYPFYYKFYYPCHFGAFSRIFYLIIYTRSTYARLFILIILYINPSFIFTQSSRKERLTYASFCVIIMLKFDEGGGLMTIFRFRRAWALAFALILAAFLLFSPLLDVYGVHDHSCSANKCILCLTSGAASFLRDLCIFALFFAAAALPTVLFRISLGGRQTATVPSPVALKNKITS